MEKRLRVNVGCGQTPTTGWRNFDNSMGLLLARVPLLPKLLSKFKILDTFQYQFIGFAQSNQIEYCNATKGLPFTSGSVDALYSSHMLEHLDRTDATLFIKEARRVLRTGGMIRLAVPDLRKKVEDYLETDDCDAFIFSTRLWQSRPRTIVQRLRFLAVGPRHHLWMYDARSLCSLLQSHGFVNASVLRPGETKIQDPGALDLKERLDESLYVEAENS